MLIFKIYLFVINTVIPGKKCQPAPNPITRIPETLWLPVKEKKYEKINVPMCNAAIRQLW